MYSCKKKNAISSKIQFDIHWGQRKGQMVWLITHKHTEGSLNVSEPLNLQKLLWVKFEIKKIKHGAQCNAHRKRDLYEHQNKMKNAEGDIKVWGCSADSEPGPKLKFVLNIF